MPGAHSLRKRATRRGRTGFLGLDLCERLLALGSEYLCAHHMFTGLDTGLGQAIGCFRTSPADWRPVPR
jgi:hypothetical protein